MQCRVRNEMVVYCSVKLCLANNDRYRYQGIEEIVFIYKYFTLACDYINIIIHTLYKHIKKTYSETR